MAMRETFRKFSSLVISVDEDSKDWLKSPGLRSAWHRFFGFLLVTVVINVLVALTPLAVVLARIPDGSYWYRLVMAGLFTVALFLLFKLTVSYFAFTIQQGRLIRLKNVLFFYLAELILFGLLYYFMFLASPVLFRYDATNVHWFSSIGAQGFEQWATKLFFVLYSAFKSVGGSLQYIESESVIVSVVNYVQTLYTFCLVALLIAGYVNQNSDARLTHHWCGRLSAPHTRRYTLK